MQRLCAEQRDALNNWLPWFAQRLRAGRIVEGHGDLRPERICLQPEPVIIDCLEFSKNLRVADCADEICFLALELERLQAPDLADALIENYLTLANYRPPSSLLHFYQGVRACVRARIAIRHLDEKNFAVINFGKCAPYSTFSSLKNIITPLSPRWSHYYEVD